MITIFSIISTICGIIGLILCAQRKISWFLFGTFQTLSYAVVSYLSHLWFNLGLQGFTLIIMIIGYISWKKNYTTQVEVKNIPNYLVLLILFVIFVISKTDLEIFTTLCVIIAQILMVFRIRQQWLFYIISDIVFLPLWFSLHNWFFFGEYIFFLINAIYGYIKWRPDERSI